MEYYFTQFLFFLKVMAKLFVAQNINPEDT